MTGIGRRLKLKSLSCLPLTLCSMSSVSSPHSLAFLFPGDAGVDAGGGAAHGRCYFFDVLPAISRLRLLTLKRQVLPLAARPLRSPVHPHAAAAELRPLQPCVPQRRAAAPPSCVLRSVRRGRAREGSFEVILPPLLLLSTRDGAQVEHPAHYSGMRAAAPAHP